jgi:hypothetical protein
MTWIICHFGRTKVEEKLHLGVRKQTILNTTVLNFTRQKIQMILCLDSTDLVYFSLWYGCFPRIIIIQFNSIQFYLCAKLNSPEANYKISTNKKMGRVRSKKVSESNNIVINIKWLWVHYYYLNLNIDTTITINYYYLIITFLLIHLNTWKQAIQKNISGREYVNIPTNVISSWRESSRGTVFAWGTRAE